MRRALFLVGSAVVVAMASLLVRDGTASAATPKVISVVEGRAAGTGDPVLMLVGRALNAAKTFELFDKMSTSKGFLEVRSKTSSIVVLGLPAGLAQGDYDLRLTYGGAKNQSVGVKLEFSVSFDGTGTATTVARSDHDHAGAYVDIGGDSMSGTLAVSPVSTSVNGIAVSMPAPSGHGISGVVGASSNSNAFQSWGVYGTVASTFTGTTALLGTYPSAGVFGEATSSGTDNSCGVFGRSTSQTGAGVRGHAEGSGATYGVLGFSNSPAGRGVAGISQSSGTGVYAHALTNGNALVVNQIGTGFASTVANNCAIFQNSGTNVARIDRTGLGLFNGGTATTGADFAESVAVDAPLAEFEPGDVVVIDVKARRRFSLSRSAESPLVAGVYSTKPGLLGSIHDVAGSDEWRTREIPLGIVGIVPTKVCDEGGPIECGDLLVTASVPGHARKAPAAPRVGTVLGKALEPHAKGRAKIEVLLVAR